MTTAHLILPALAMMFLTISLIFIMGHKRSKAVTNNDIDGRFYKTYDQGQEPPHLRVLTRHMQNHFEVPPIFYAAILLLVSLNAITIFGVITAWVFVGARYAHTLIHLNGNKVVPRFLSFIVSVLALLALWVHLVVSTIGQL